jgi:DNA-binding CsgD family transcriptional regulator
MLPIALLAETCARLGDRARAAVLYDLLLPFAGQNLSSQFYPCFFGAVTYYLGLLATTLGRQDAAAEQFDAASEMHARLGARPFLAHTQLAYAGMLHARRRRGDRAHARSLLEEAASTYAELGMPDFSLRARELRTNRSAAASGASEVTYPNRLSAREVEVLRLVAQGKSNPAIARALSISPYTVVRHLSNIFDKTGMTNRVEAATYATQHGLLA